MSNLRIGSLWRMALVLLAAALVVAACGSDESESSEESGDSETAQGSDDLLKVRLVINGNLGDKSFFDGAQNGMEMAESELGVEIDTIELGPDPASWEPGLIDAAADEDSYDIIVTSTFNMAEPLQKVAPDHPDKNFIIFDVVVDYDACDCSNVHSITYKANEGAYLGGVYAALMTKLTDIEGINDEATVGFVGGIDIPVVADFAVGFAQGANDNGVEVLEQYAGDFGDPARGKEISLALYSQGADIIFHAAAGTGQGVFEAAAEQGAWSMGVDSDQAAILAESAEAEASTILTSVLKNVDVSIFRAVDLHMKGELDYGGSEALTLADGGVGIVRSGLFAEITPPEVIAAVDEAKAAIIAGDIVVDSALGG